MEDKEIDSTSPLLFQEIVLHAEIDRKRIEKEKEIFGVPLGCWMERWIEKDNHRHR